MKKLKKIGMLILTFLLMSTSLYAVEGPIGYFGGISTGEKLPTITSLSQKKSKKSTKYNFPYKENIYLSGKPEIVEGTIQIRPGKEIDKEKGQGKYNESYIIKAQNKDGSTKVTRSITLETEYIYEPNRKQITKTSTFTKWSEVVTVGGKTYKLDPKLSSFSKSILEDETPGVMYYRGDIQYDAVYQSVGGDAQSQTTVSVHGPIYGYNQAFARTETQKRSIMIDNGQNQYYIEETPTLTVYKDIQYGVNEPDAISFGGNYKEFIRSEGALTYNILQGSPKLYDDELTGSMSIENSPTIEQLSVPSGLQLKGHPAESDIRKMYSLKIFTEDPRRFSANQVVTKGEYIAMLVRALNIPIPEEEVAITPFKDVKASDPLYKYAVAAYQSGLVSGNVFNGKQHLTREMMYLLNMRAIGLERLGIGTGNVATAFIDDRSISQNAKSSLYAAAKIGLAIPANGYIFPQKYVTKAESATFLNQLISYLRYQLQKDYNEKMLY